METILFICRNSYEGNIYQLLASVDQLATMLQAKNDTEQKDKGVS